MNEILKQLASIWVDTTDNSLCLSKWNPVKEMILKLDEINPDIRSALFNCYVAIDRNILSLASRSDNEEALDVSYEILGLLGDFSSDEVADKFNKFIKDELAVRAKN